MQNCLKSEFLMKQLKKQFMQHKLLKQRKKANQTAHIVLLDMMPTKARSGVLAKWTPTMRSEEHTSELQSQSNLVCRLLLEKTKINNLLNLPSLFSSHYFIAVFLIFP